MRRARFQTPLNYLAVFFFAGTVLLGETVLFHATKYVLDYALAMTVIGCAVAGIGLGAFFASRYHATDRDLFAWCCGGTTASLYLAAYVLLRHAYLPALLPSMALVFVFPSLFIATAFGAGRPGESICSTCWEPVPPSR